MCTSIEYIGVSAKIYGDEDNEEYRHKIDVLKLSGKSSLILDKEGINYWYKPKNCIIRSAFWIFLGKKCFSIHHDFNYACFIIKDNEKSSIYDKTGLSYI